MHTAVEINHDGRMQMALVEYDVRYGKPYIVRVKIGLEDVTKKIGPMSWSKIKIAITEDSIRRQTV